MLRDYNVDDLTSRLQTVDLNDKKITVNYELLGCYNWAANKAICVPGYPTRLRPNWQSLQTGRLKETPSTKEEVHPNEFMHDVYFEAVEEVLNHCGKKLTEFDILTDRNNIRKLDCAIRGDAERYENFEISLRKHGNLIILKREESDYRGTRIGLEFEDKICENNGLVKSHAVVCSTVEVGAKITKLLIRSEVDCLSPHSKVPSKKDYTQVTNSSSGLKVFKLPSTVVPPPLRITDLGEIKMAGQLKDDHMFQSWLGGVTWLAHGINPRYRAKTNVSGNISSYKQRLARVVQEIMDRGEQMEEGKTYFLKRENSGTLKFGQKNDSRTWFGQKM
eukprot:TRINITY_DN225_c0_g1_i1.p1 TRINITY_DN225_c0_g1~~TRINITY_DN225_c0_g1_i1.p1  ORF type:complete len:333 (-),score=55.06 TRINITY_DN225_c0_g1_i1:66-1064(-)